MSTQFDNKFGRVSALTQYAVKADGRAELNDHGDRTEDSTETFKRHNLDENMVGHFNDVIWWRHHRWRDSN